MSLPTGNLRCYYDGEIGISQSGGFVSQWNDQSGNGKHLTQPTGGLQPSYITGVLSYAPRTHAVSFDGVNDFLSNAFITFNGNPVTVAMVVTPNNSSVAASTVYGLAASKPIGASDPGWGITSGNGFSFTEYPRFQSEYYTGTGNSPPTLMYTNGFLLPFVVWRIEAPGDTYFILIQFPAHTSATSLYLGSFAGGGYGNVAISAMAAWDKTLSSSEISQVWKTWKSRYNFGDNALVPVASSGSDAEETVTGGAVNTTNVSLDLGYRGTNKQLVGLRFNNVPLYRGKSMRSAWLYVIANSTQAGVSPTLTVRGEAVDNSAVFTTATSNISSRATTTANIAWSSLPTWNAGSQYILFNINTIIQEIINRPGWAYNNSISLIISAATDAVNNPFRDIVSFNGSSVNCAYLQVENERSHLLGNRYFRGYQRGVERGIS